MIIGIGLIAMGTFIERQKKNINKDEETIDEVLREEATIKSGDTEKKERQLLEKRIDLLEEMLFKKTLEEESQNSMVLEEKIEGDSLEQYKLIKKHEKQGKSIDEIAKLLHMNKGEVLLLKSLYKNL